MTPPPTKKDSSELGKRASVTTEIIRYVYQYTCCLCNENKERQFLTRADFESNEIARNDICPRCCLENRSGEPDKEFAPLQEAKVMEEEA